MRSILERAKESLIERTTEIFLDRRGEIEMEEYPSYFQGMGALIAIIEKYETLSDLVKGLEDGVFEPIGLFPSDEDMFDVFFNSIP